MAHPHPRGSHSARPRPARGATTPARATESYWDNPGDLALRGRLPPGACPVGRKERAIERTTLTTAVACTRRLALVPEVAAVGRLVQHDAPRRVQAHCREQQCTR